MLERIPKQPARIKCLGCDNEFNSKDKVTNRICPRCTKRNNKERTPRTMSSQIQLDDRVITIDCEDA